MSTISKLWKIFRAGLTLIRLLSLDIILGVYCSYLFASTILKSNSPGILPLLVCLAVWLVYTFDHLSDAAWLGENAAKPVYIWHRENRRILVLISVFLGCGGLICSLVFLPSLVIIAGGGGLSCLLLYMVVHSLPGIRKRYLFKEVWIALIYTLGVWMFPLLYSSIEPGFSVLLQMLAFFCLVFVNVLTYSLFEYSFDKAERMKSFIVAYGPGKGVKLVKIFLFIAGSSAVLSLLMDFSNWHASMIMLVMAGILGLIHLFPVFFGRYERFGITADLVFFLPAGILLFIY